MNYQPGTQIGRYRLLDRIGEGGPNLIFIAEQTEPVKRKVALKVIKPGLDSKEVVARFEAERQALAMMDHPNIVRLLDAGTTEFDRPYFVMDLIRGVPIIDYCEQGRLNLDERLALFATVCHAVQYVHQTGIIHRDIEPSNVLVTLVDGKPAAKLIDFGLAKAVSFNVVDPEFAPKFPPQMIGKPAYMSPEQALMSPLNVDSRADVYSLGVLLYELMTRTTPIEKRLFENASDDEIRRILAEEMPLKPSQKVIACGSPPNVVASRATSPRKLSRMLKGKLDGIVMMAIEKDRTRRYQTADALAQDIKRYLAGEQILACPPPFGDRLRRYFRRKR